MDFQAAEIHRFVQENREEAIDCLRELLATPSNSGEEVAVSKVFCRWIERAGLEPTVVGISEEHPNVLAEWFGSKGIRERGLFLMGIWIRFRPRMEMKERMAPILEWWRTMRFMEEALLI